MKNSKLDQAITSASAQRIYDWIGNRYDWLGGFDALAKQRALDLLGLTPGIHILEIGVGTGKSLAQIYTGIQPGGIAVGIDLSRKMLDQSAKRSHSHLCLADARNLPFSPNCFDRVFISYVLDLVSIFDIPGILVGAQRSLKASGRIVVIAMTEGVDPPSRALVAIWKAMYKVSPITCAGCRPLQLTNMLESAGFADVQRQVVVQMAVPSEILTARKINLIDSSQVYFHPDR